jgi:Ca2+-transporting ATPase
MYSFHSATLDDCFKQVKSSSAGLSIVEARHRLDKHGANRLAATKPLGWLPIFFSQFKSPLIFILLLAGIISVIAQEYLEAEIVFGAVLINVVIGFIQENKANNALNQLQKMVEHKTIVRRQEGDQEVDSAEVMVGDIIILRAGEQIPVDARLIKSIDLQINEASLTGESAAIYKNIEILNPDTQLADRRNMIYSGTVVESGSGEALVVSKGRHTELGKISEMVQTTMEVQTPLQKRLAQLSKFIGLIAAVVSVLIVVAGLIQGRDFLEIFLTAIAVAVAAVPEGLAVAVTVILVLGMKKILKQKALTRKLIAAETLGSTTVICSDKTGTLTEGRMQVAHIVTGSKEFVLPDLFQKNNQAEITNALRALEIGLFCNNAILEKNIDELQPEKIVGLPVEVALLTLGRELGLDQEQLLAREPKVAELPFNSGQKFMITLHQLAANNYVLYEKGAPEKIIAKASKLIGVKANKVLDGKDREELLRQTDELTSRGLRVMAVAFKSLKKLPWSLQTEPKDWSLVDSDLVFVGLIAFKDPLRPDAKETIALCRQAGIRPIIITGDHPLTAAAIAKEVGLDGQPEDVITGARLETIDDEVLREVVKKYNIYARVSPEHKLRIIRALQANGEVVAMTGDGLNDSPALKMADIGVCLGSGTDIAKQTADIVLLDDNFKVLVSAVEEGRIIFRNLRKSVAYLVSDCFSEIFLIVGSIVFNLPLAILPAQILWINIVNDGFPNFSLAFEHDNKGVMDSPPLKRLEPIINKEMKVIIFGLGLVRDFFILLLFVYLYKNQPLFGWDLDYLRTLFFALLGFKSISAIFSLRSLSLPFFKIKQGHNPYLLGAFVISLLLLILAVYWSPLQKILGTVALSGRSWLLIFGLSFVNIIIIEIIKYFFNHKSHAQKKLSA